jgi:flagellar basal body-associated protein FliL
MADKKEDVKQKKESQKQESESKSSIIKRFLPWIVLFGVVLISAGMGLGLGRVFAGWLSSEPAADQQQTDQAVQSQQRVDVPADNSVGTWYYDLEPAVANLNEPGVTRYVRATLTLEFSNRFDQKHGMTFLEQKKPYLKHLLTLYLANQTIQDLRGEKNLKRIQTEVLDSFNEHLFPDSRPQLIRILFKEFAIQ